MKTTIMLAVYVVMAATSATAFADASGAARDPREGNEQVRTIQSPRLAGMMPREQTAAPRSGQPVDLRQERAIEEARRERAAIQEYNQRRYLEQTWTAAP